MLILWALVHALYLVLMVLMGAAEDEAPTITPNSLWIIGLCIALSFVEVRRRGERALWGNLGLSMIHIACLAAIVASAGELLLALLMR